MDIKTLKDRKPWFVPKWLWNQAVNALCDTAKSNLTIQKVTDVAGDALCAGVERLVEGRDDKTIDMVCSTVEHSGHVFTMAAAAARDKVITAAEREQVGQALSDVVTALVPQSVIDDEIEKVRAALLFS